MSRKLLRLFVSKFHDARFPSLLCEQNFLGKASATVNRTWEDTEQLDLPFYDSRACQLWSVHEEDARVVSFGVIINPRYIINDESPGLSPDLLLSRSMVTSLREGASEGRAIFVALPMHLGCPRNMEIPRASTFLFPILDAR